ncbi:MAG: ABC transporter ATP-binding protein [Candidatus Latescibacterota bacterium]|nr:MAG: ABC transporter ATP-binding protein [Candidatus Latescibacterota bacterium]
MDRDTNSKQKRRKALRTIGAYLARYRKGLTIGGACLIVTNLLLLVNPWILKVTVDELKGGITRDRLLLYASVFVAVTVVSGVFRFLMRRIIIGISRKIEFDMRGDFFAHLERLSPSFYNKNRTGDLMALATNDLNAVRSLVGPGVMYSMNTVVVAGLALSLMIVLSWKLTTVAILPLVILSVGMYHSMKLIHRYFERVQKRFGDLNSRAQENLAGIRVVRTYARENHEIADFEKQSRIYVKANMKLYRVQSLLQPLLTSVAGLGALFILGYGGKQVIDETITLGTFVAFSGYLAMLIWPMIALGWVMNIMERGLASMQRINVIFGTEPEIKDVRETADVSPLSPRDRSIEFENVSFAYDTSVGREPVLRDLSFTIRDGETAAVVGPTGSGKSTLVSLILRLYEPQTGRVLVGGVPVARIPIAELRSLFGLIPQDIFLFSDTIAANMLFGVSSMNGNELDRLSRLAAIHGEIQGFPDKYETMLGERGINLSGGQKQRVAIARAIAMDPGILILDDALSSVDTDTEEKILRSLREEMRSRTAVLISHRISTVREADRILVLDNGRLVEEGSHNELILLDGVYADMFNKQQIMYDLERG